MLFEGKKGDNMANGTLVFDTQINSEGFKSGINKLSTLAQTGLKTVGKVMTGVAAAAGAGITAAVKVGAAFEAEMSKVQAISGATGDELQQLSDKAQEMGAKTKFSATESAQALEYMAMAGWKTDDMLNGLEGIMNLAAASGEDLATTSDIVTDALTAFGMSASDSTRFANVLAQASANANTNVSKMGETFKYVAPVAGAMGYSVEDTALAIGLMANSSIKASQAGTYLRAILTRMAKPTKEVQSAMDALNLSLTNSDGSMKSLNEVMEDLRNGFSGLSEAESVQMAATLGGQEAMSGLLAIVNASTTDFDKLKDSVYNCTDAAANMATVTQDNLAGQLTSLKSKAEGLGIAFYGSIQEPLKELASVGVKTLEDLNTAYASNGFVGFINEIGNKIPILQTVTDKIADISLQLQGMNTDKLMSLGKALAVLAGAVPGVLALGQGIESTAGIVEVFNDISSGFISKIGAVPSGVKKVGNSLQEIGGTLKGVGNALILPFEGVGEKIGGVLSKVTYHLGYYGAGIQNQLSKLASPVVQKISEFTEPFAKIGSIIGSHLGKIGTQISGYAGIIGDSLKPILMQAASFAPTFFELLNIGAGVGIVVAGLGLVYNQFGEQIDQILLMTQTKGPEVITNFANGITEALPGLIGSGVALITKLLETITANLPALISAGIGIVTTLVSSLASQLPALIPVAVDMILTLIESLLDNLPQLVSSGLELMEGLAQGIANAIPKVAEKAPIIIGKLASTIITNLPKMLQTGVKIITQLAVGLVQGIPSLLGKIPSMISQIKNAFTSVNWGQVGLNIIKGIASGIAGAAGRLVDAAVKAATDALNWVKKKLGIHSPSTVFRDQVGKNMALGVGVGFEKNIPSKDMSAKLQYAVEGLKKDVVISTSLQTNQVLGGINYVSGFDKDTRTVSSDNPKPREIIIHTHVDLDGKEVGNSVTKYVDQNMSDDEDLRRRGN